MVKAREHVAGRKSLPRNARVIADVDGYKEQLFSPKRDHRDRDDAMETPATKISRSIASKVMFLIRLSMIYCYDADLAHSYESRFWFLIDQLELRSIVRKNVQIRAMGCHDKSLLMLNS